MFADMIPSARPGGGERTSGRRQGKGPFYASTNKEGQAEVDAKWKRKGKRMKLLEGKAVACFHFPPPQNPNLPVYPLISLVGSPPGFYSSVLC